MNGNRFLTWIIRLMAVVLLVIAIKGVVIALGHEHVPAAAYFSYAAGLFFGTCLLSGSFQLKLVCMVTGALTLLSLIGMDLAKWRSGLQSLADVFITWGIVGGFLAFTFFIFWRRSRKDK